MGMGQICTKTFLHKRLFLPRVNKRLSIKKYNKKSYRTLVRVKGNIGSKNKIIKKKSILNKIV